MKVTRTKTELISFHCGTNGMEKHSDFIKSIDNNKIKIIHSFTKYNRFKEHMPDYLYYVIQYKEQVEIQLFTIICNFVNKLLGIC